MEKPIKSPNLPECNVSLGVLDCRARKTIVSELKKHGVKVISAGRCEGLYAAVECHADMFMHHLGGEDIVVAPNAPKETVQELWDNGFNIIIGEKVISRKYPEDVAYNVARIGDYAVCNVLSTDRVLLSCLEDMGITIIDVKQGYAKCSICIVGPGAVITSDDGIYKAMSRLDFDVLKINPGSIELEGLNYGFIGGASGLISKDTVAFTGNIVLHPDFTRIHEFLSRYGKNIKPLDDENLMDVGTFIPLKEYCIEE